ncbi:MAG: enoyl-CoA hydratase-related protein [Bacteroidota bacterium]
MNKHETILYEQAGGVAYITLNRPTVFNSFNRTMALALQEVLATCAQEPEVRAIVITGSGKAFCAGQDLKEVTDPTLNPGFRTILEEHYAPIIEQLRSIEKPILAAVNGVAAGAGANIALACDVVIAHEKASFIQAFSKIGLVPDSGGTYFLPRLIGFQRALALAMLGDKVTAQEAQQMGMIYRAVPHESYAGAVKQTAHKLANMPTKALGLIKKAFNHSMQHSLTEQLALEADCQMVASETNDYQEGVTAFLEKRTPNYKGS